MVQKWDLTFIQSFLGDSVEEDQSPFQVGLYEQQAKFRGIKNGSRGGLS